MQKTLLKTLACIAISTMATLSAASDSQARPLEGLTLSAAQEDDFFKFFHLKEKNKEERDNLNTFYFAPESRNDILLSVDADKQGKILQMSIVVGRDFIDNPKTNIFARDIVKSFIDAATPLKDVSQTKALVNEIFFRGTQLSATEAKNVKYKGKQMPGGTKLYKVGEGDLKAGDVAVVMSGDVPPVADKPSDAFATFNGSLERCEQILPSAKLVMMNHSFSTGKFLEVRVDVNTVKKEPKFEVVFPGQSKPTSITSGEARQESKPGGDAQPNAEAPIKPAESAEPGQPGIGTSGSSESSQGVTRNQGAESVSIDKADENQKKTTDMPPVDESKPESTK